MTCAHVLGLIDAGRFADYPRAHFDAAWQHARDCARCGRALAAATALTADLAALWQPAPPPELAGAVLARVARIERTSPPVAVALSEAINRSIARDWSPWATTAGGVGVAVALSMLTGDRAPIDITSIRAMVLTASLGLYVAGLFAPLHGERSR